MFEDQFQDDPLPQQTPEPSGIVFNRGHTAELIKLGVLKDSSEVSVETLKEYIQLQLDAAKMLQDGLQIKEHVDNAILIYKLLNDELANVAMGVEEVMKNLQSVIELTHQSETMNEIEVVINPRLSEIEQMMRRLTTSAGGCIDVAEYFEQSIRAFEVMQGEMSRIQHLELQLQKSKRILDNRLKALNIFELYQQLMEILKEKYEQFTEDDEA